MKVYKTQRQIEKDIKNGVLFIKEDVKFECCFVIEASIKVIGNINARNITAWDINAGNINARNITAWDINARDITAEDISYHAFCCVYKSIKCKSISARRQKSQPPICLDGKLEYKTESIGFVDSIASLIFLADNSGFSDL